MPEQHHRPEELPPITAAQARAVDRYALEVLGLPGAVLMENAAINTAAVVLDLLEDSVELDEDRFRVGVLCGGGNNGGDGYAIARHLLDLGIDVTVYAARPIDELTGDAAINAQAAQVLNIPIIPCADGAAAEKCKPAWARCHVLIDALLGTGFTGQVRTGMADVITALNSTRPEVPPEVSSEAEEKLPAAQGKLPGVSYLPGVLAVDVPSGLEADTGQVGEASGGGATSGGGGAVKADVTVTFVAPKAGFSQPAAQKYLGRLVVAGIGLPDAAVRVALGWEPEGPEADPGPA